jgi:methenyltetrahydrofolate cyclohydrolase
MIDKHTGAQFLDALASAEPTPGGGGAAALMGAMGAALISMVCRLTIGKKGHEAADAPMRALLEQSETLRNQLAAMVAEDARAFDTLMSAYRLPKGSDDEKAARSVAIQSGLKVATEAPLACARAAAEAVRLAAAGVEIGNVNVISDVGVGALSAQAALRSAALNVHINVPQIRDRAFTDAATREIEALLAECLPLAEQVHSRVTLRMA